MCSSAPECCKFFLKVKNSIYNFNTHLSFLCQGLIKVFRCQWAFCWGLGSVNFWQRHACPIFLFRGQGDVPIIIAWYRAQRDFAVCIRCSSRLLGFARPHRGAAWRVHVALHGCCCCCCCCCWMRHGWNLACMQEKCFACLACIHLWNAVIIRRNF
jgi:hypothetical protein